MNHLGGSNRKKGILVLGSLLKEVPILFSLPGVAAPMSPWHSDTS